MVSGYSDQLPRFRNSENVEMKGDRLCGSGSGDNLRQLIEQCGPSEQSGLDLDSIDFDS
jgi:hypothetical protein